jgi:hypothetical protein
MGQDTEGAIMFTGGLDSDTDERVMAPGDYRDALNIHNVVTQDGKTGSVTKVPGSLQVSNPFLAAGDNKNIGDFEDNKGDSIISLTYNSNGYHLISRYYRNKGTNELGVIEKVMQVRYPAVYPSLLQPNPLNFDPDHYATGINLVGDNLYYTDYFNSPREVNIVRANETDKRKKFVVYFDPDALTMTDPDAQKYSFNVYQDDGTLILGAQVNLTTAATTLEGRVKDFITEYHLTPGAVANFIATNRGSFVEVEMAQPGDFFCKMLSPLIPINVLHNLVAPENFYPENLPLVSGSYEPLSYELLERVKYPPKCEPQVQYKTDANRSVNLVREKVFQFRCQYVYEDFSTSVWGAISTIAMPTQACDPGVTQQSDNYIEVDFSDPRLSNPSKMWKIRQVNIALREHNEGDWQLAVSLSPWEWGTKKQIYKFYNDGLYQSIDQARAIEPYDSVGLLVKSQQYVANRIFDAGIVEGYDKVPVDAKLAVTYDATKLEQRPTYTIRGAIFIRSISNGWEVSPGGAYVTPELYNQPIYYGTQANVGISNAPMWGGMSESTFNFLSPEYMALTKQQPFAFPGVHGFVAYLAGTSHYAVSQQYYWTTAQQNFNGNLYYGQQAGNIAMNNLRAWIEGNNGGVDFAAGNNCRVPFAGFSYMDNSNTGGIIGEDGAPASHIFSTFEIKNVPEGEYILRFADQYTTAAELSATTLDYQKRSMPVLEVNGFVGTEGVIHVNSSTVDSPGSKIITVGRTIIPDMAGNKVLAGYIADHDKTLGTPSYAHILADTRIEKALVLQSDPTTLNNDVFNDYALQQDSTIFWWVDSENSLTDHNGYFFYALEYGDAATMTVNTTLSKCGARTMNLSVEYSRSGLPSVQNALTQGLVDGAWRNTDDDVSNYSRTKVYALIQQQAAGCSTCPTSYVVGANVVIGHGGWMHSDAFGEVTIPCYTDTPYYVLNATPIRHEWVVLNEGESTCRVDFVRQNLIDMDIVTIDTNGGTAPPPYNATAQDFYYSLGAITINILSLLVSTQGWKHGSDEIFGIVYYDLADRRTAVCVSEQTKVHIPFYNEPTGGWTSAEAGVPLISWSIYSEPPSWAKKWQWVRTRNLQLNYYLQFCIDQVGYYATMADATNPLGVATTQALGTIVKIRLDNLLYYKRKNPNTNIAYTFAKGDRIRFIKKASGAFFNYYGDYEILDVNSDAELALFFTNDQRMPALGIGDMYEIYTPHLDETNHVFYEFGECYEVEPIIQDGVLRYRHSGQTADQTYQPSPYFTSTAIPAEGTFKTGNTYFRNRTMNVDVEHTADSNRVIQVIEDESISDFWDSEDESIGRTNTDAIDIGRIERPTAIRLSDRYIEDTKTNGLSSFQALNQKQLNSNYGLINRLMLVSDDILMCVCENSKIVTMYVDKDVLRSASSGQQLLVAIANEVVPQTNILQRTMGSQFGESVAINDEQHVFMFDRNLGGVPRYSGNQLFAVSDYKMIEYFSQRGEELSANHSAQVKVPSVYDRYHDEYIVTFPNLAATVPQRATAVLRIPDADEKVAVMIKHGTTVLMSYEVNAYEDMQSTIVYQVNNYGSGWTAEVDDVTGEITLTAPLAGTAYNGSIIEVIFTPFLSMQPVGYSYKLSGGTDTSSEEVPGATIAFNKLRNRWVTRYGFIPENYCSLRQEIVAFKNGELWLQGVNPLQNNFFGEQQSSTVTFPVNKAPGKVKIFVELKTSSDTVWYASSLLINEGQPYPVGMISILPAGKFKYIEGNYYSDILRDMQTPGVTNPLLNGRPMRGDAMMVTLAQDEPTPSALFMVSCVYVYSEKS